MATTLRASGSLTATMRAKVTASMTMPRMANRRIEPRPPPRWVSRSRPKPRSIPRPTAAAVAGPATVITATTGISTVIVSRVASDISPSTAGVS
ncbi:Uncharacterised protein [Mycobacteroides abscessus subsp. abscessus]|nr:Uncharacterised protein [Mycobacteroides abscessus subsp. abscessus]